MAEDQKSEKQLGLEKIERKKRLKKTLGRFFSFSTIYSRIIILNIVALAFLLIGILFQDQTREGLIDAKLESLITQATVIGGALSASASDDNFNSENLNIDELIEKQSPLNLDNNDLFSAVSVPIDPEEAAQILQHSLVTKSTRARIYDAEGVLILDSNALYSDVDILQTELSPLGENQDPWYDRFWQWIKVEYLRQNLALYKEHLGENGRKYSEVATALNGHKGSNVRVDENGDLILSVAVPISKLRSVLGILFLTTSGNDIAAMVYEERISSLQLFAIVALIITILSYILARTIAKPMRRLSVAAEEVAKDSSNDHIIPDFSHRKDEIGDLSGSLSKMTNSLFSRIEAIERFAADVSHELKNPLTSLRSAVEILPIAKTEENKKRLSDIILQDIQRLDRLITDISDASRLDAEMVRDEKQQVNLGTLLETLCNIANETKRETEATINLNIHALISNKHKGQVEYMVEGHNIRLGQVIQNLISNARSFSPINSHIDIDMKMHDQKILITVEDHGTGIQAEKIERIFERFYTDRQHMLEVDPDEYDQQDFGNNSGLGLSIVRQIIEAHQGEIWAENVIKADKVAGAKFSIYLPLADKVD